jgi:hypothetical protein
MACQEEGEILQHARDDGESWMSEAIFHMPLYVNYSLKGDTFYHCQLAEGGRLEYRENPRSRELARGHDDAWGLCQRFLKIKRDHFSSELPSFLEGFPLAPPGSQDCPTTIAGWQNWQDLMRDALTRKWWVSRKVRDALLRKFDRNFPRFIRQREFTVFLRGPTGPPILRIMANYGLDAMLIAIHLQLVEGARFRICAKPGCEELFRAGGRGRWPKIYHSLKCAHAMAERRARKAGRRTRRP